MKKLLSLSAIAICTCAVASDVAKYQVKSGDTLWAIALSQFGTGFKWRDIWNANPQIKNPNVILPGQVLNMPEYTASKKQPKPMAIAIKVKPNTHKEAAETTSIEVNNRLVSSEYAIVDTADGKRVLARAAR